MAGTVAGQNLLGTGNAGAALTTLKQLRSVRAKTGRNNSLKGTVYLNTILEERAIGLCGEQPRWFVLKRTRTLADRVKKFDAQGAASIKEFHYYRPIPRSQPEAVTNLSSTKGQGFRQNDGY